VVVKLEASPDLESQASAKGRTELWRRQERLNAKSRGQVWLVDFRVEARKLKLDSPFQFPAICFSSFLRQQHHPPPSTTSLNIGPISNRKGVKDNYTLLTSEYLPFSRLQGLRERWRFFNSGRLSTMRTINVRPAQSITVIAQKAN
jgi:hypothetical protein